MKEKPVNSKMIGKILAISFSFFIFIFGALLCIKPICSSAINQMLIKEEFKFYIVDVVYEKYPEMSENQLNAIAEAADIDSLLEKIISRYLDATMVSLQDPESFEMPAVSELLDKLNQELADTVESQMKDGISEAEKRDFILYLDMKEDQVRMVLYKVPFYLDYFNSYSPAVLQLYGVLTSKVLLMVIAIFTGISGGSLIYVRRRDWLWLRSIGFAAIVDAVLLGVCLPLLINVAGPVITNYMLGMTFQMSLSLLYMLGGIFLAAGMLILVVRYFLVKHVSHSHVSIVLE